MKPLPQKVVDSINITISHGYILEHLDHRVIRMRSTGDWPTTAYITYDGLISGERPDMWDHRTTRDTVVSNAFRP